MLDELRYLLHITDTGTFTAAARKAHLSQPALSAAVRRLEDVMGARLFHRGAAGAELTAAGHALLPHARAALAAVEDGRRAVAELEAGATGEGRLGAGATACTYFLPPILATYRKRWPGVVLRVREAFGDELEELVTAGAIDIAIITAATRRGGRRDGLDPWRDDELIVVGAPGVNPRDAGWITFGAGSPTRALLLARNPGAQVVMELGSIAAVKGHVRAGIGLALVSRAAVAADVARGALVELELPWAPVTRRLALRHRGVDRLPPAAARLRDVLLERLP
ncbi:MAG: LysR family transcriptional regulator [Kofleriaceae bacterium]|nr:LysR family transcriptional regulator [Kofleriaceae bacterium]